MKKLCIAMIVTLMLAGMAAVAHAIPMQLLPQPTAANVACGKLVNEAKLLKNLQAWQKQYNAMLRSLEKLSEKQAYSMVGGTWGSMPTKDLDLIEPLNQLTQLLEDVLLRWGDDAMTAQDKQLLGILHGYGITPGSVDGTPYLRADINFFRTRFGFPPAAEPCLALLQAQPNDYTYGEGWLRYECAELVNWLMAWDKLLRDAPAQPWKEAAQTRYLYLLQLLVFHKDNAINVQVGEDDVPYWREMLQQGITAHPDTLTAALLKEALDDTTATSCSLSAAAQQRILARAKAGFAAGMGTTGEAAHRTSAASAVPATAPSGTTPSGTTPAPSEPSATFPPADAPVIVLTVKQGATITFTASGKEGAEVWKPGMSPLVYRQASIGENAQKNQNAATGTPVWVETAPLVWQQETLDNTATKFTMTAEDTTIKIYGAITHFSCSENKENITALDVRQNPLLRLLACGDNALQVLDVSQNTALEVLECGQNALTALDVSANTALQGLNCRLNKLTALDVRNNTALRNLFCVGNALTSLDVSVNTALEYLNCAGNELTTLILPKKINLKNVSYGGNPLTKSDIQRR